MYVKKMCLQPGLHLEPHWISLQLQCSPKLHRRLGRRQFPLPQHVWHLNSRHFPSIDSRFLWCFDPLPQYWLL